MSFEDLVRDEMSDTARSVPSGPAPYEAIVRRAGAQRRRKAAGITVGLLPLAAGPTTLYAVQATGDRAPSPAATNPGPDLPTPSPERTDTRLDPRCMTGRVLCISKQTRTLTWVIDGQKRQSLDVQLGTADTPTREGTFKVDLKSRDHQSTLYDSPIPYAMFFSGGQTVYDREDFTRNGYRQGSTGSVATRDEEAIAQLFDQVRTGDKVVVHP